MAGHCDGVIILKVRTECNDIYILYRINPQGTFDPNSHPKLYLQYAFPPHSPPSLRHFVMQGLLPPVVVLVCGFFLPVCSFVRTKQKACSCTPSTTGAAYAASGAWRA